MLSTQELQVLIGCSRGYTSKEIATHLGLSRRTVDQYAAGAASKLGAPNRVAAVVTGLVRGCISCDGDYAAVAHARGPVLLSAQETRVLLLCARGLTSKEIAAHLRISRRTVDQYCASAAVRLGAPNRSNAVVKALFSGTLVLSASASELTGADRTLALWSSQRRSK
jgi:DNA-binding CsgD family transcriptional regulator